MNKVNYIHLKYLCNVNQGLQIPITKRHKTKGKNRYFYITIQFLKDSKNDRVYIERPNKSTMCNKDDILVVRTGSTGKIVTGVKGCFHNNFFKVNYDKTKVDGRYLFYCLSSKEKQKEMKKRAGITTIPDLNHFMFLDMKIPLLDLDNQKKISKILDSISNKIKLNNRINTELEAMAKTLYDYWFVQFDFPFDFAQGKPNLKGKPYKSSGGKMVFNKTLKREIPEGWEVLELRNLVSVINNNVLPDEVEPTTPYIGLEHIPRKTIILSKWEMASKVSSNKCLFEKYDILFGKIRPYFHKIGLSFISGITSTDTIVLRVNKNEFLGLVLETVSTDRFIKTATASSTGTKMPRANWKVLQHYKIPVPPSELLHKYQDLFTPIIDKIESSI